MCNGNPKHSFWGLNFLPNIPTDLLWFPTQSGSKVEPTFVEFVTMLYIMDGAMQRDRPGVMEFLEGG
jgi:hypothetical protein